MTPVNEKINLLNDEIEERKMQALWWMASAISGECQSRDLRHGMFGEKFTEAEKTKNAMETAARHIDLMKETMEARRNLLYQGD